MWLLLAAFHAVEQDGVGLSSHARVLCDAFPCGRNLQKYSRTAGTASHLWQSQGDVWRGRYHRRPIASATERHIRPSEQEGEDIYGVIQLAL